MSEEVLNLNVSKKKIVRYPFFLNQQENPHRLFALADVVSSVISFVFIMLVFEFFAIMVLPGSDKFLITVFCIIPVIGIVSRMLLRSARLGISDTGISFPILFAPWLNGRLTRSWSDLESADLHMGHDSSNYIGGNVLTLAFKSGGRVDLQTTRIPREDLRCLADGLLTWANAESLTPAVSELVARNDFEIADSQFFVFAKKHRSILSKDFGLVNNRLHEKGASLLDGAYIVEKGLAAGGNRSSYLVADIGQGRNLKLTEYDLSILDPLKRDRCVEELISISKSYKDLQLPHVLNLVDYRVHEEKFYVLMEPCLDQTLRSFVLKHGNLNEKQVTSLALKLAEAVQAVHSLDPSLILGGIRPDAIVWKKNGTVLLTEFGFANDLIMKYSDALLIDAPYAAPERIAGVAVPASDLYSIGATMYFAITKMDPECYAGAVVSAVRSKVSLSFSQLIDRLLSFDPEQRGSAAELVHDLGGFLPKGSNNALPQDAMLIGSHKGVEDD